MVVGDKPHCWITTVQPTDGLFDYHCLLALTGFAIGSTELMAEALRYALAMVNPLEDEPVYAEALWENIVEYIRELSPEVLEQYLYLRRCSWFDFVQLEADAITRAVVAVAQEYSEIIRPMIDCGVIPRSITDIIVIADTAYIYYYPEVTSRETNHRILTP